MDETRREPRIGRLRCGMGGAVVAMMLFGMVPPAMAVTSGRFLTFDLSQDGASSSYSEPAYLFRIDQATGAVVGSIDGGVIEEFWPASEPDGVRRVLGTMATDARGTTYLVVANYGPSNQPFQFSFELFSIASGSDQPPVYETTLVTYPPLTNVHSPWQIAIDRLRNRLVFVNPGEFGVGNPELRLYDLRDLGTGSPLVPLHTVELTVTDEVTVPFATTVAPDGSVYMLHATAPADPVCMSTMPPGSTDYLCRSLLVKRWEPGGALTVEGPIGLPGTGVLIAGLPFATTYLDPTRGARGVLATIGRFNALTPNPELPFLRLFDLETRAWWDVALPDAGGPLGLSGDGAGNLYQLPIEYGACSGGGHTFCVFDTACGNGMCDAPPPSLQLHKLVLSPDGSSAGAFPLDVPSTVVEGDTSLPVVPILLAPEPAQRLVLDWDAPPDVTIRALDDLVGTGAPLAAPACGSRPAIAAAYPSTTEPAAVVPEVTRDAVLAAVSDGLRRSGFDLPIVDTRYYPDDVDRAGAITVQFGASGPVAGAAFDVGCGGRGAMPVGERDRCNRRADARVLVNTVVDSAETPGRTLTAAEIAATILHQVGHALGLAHVGPPPAAGVGSIMDHVPHAEERFLDQPAAVVEPPDGTCGTSMGTTHAPLTQLRITSTCDTPAHLAAAGLSAGTDDACPVCASCGDGEALSVTVAGLATDVGLVAVQRLRGADLVGSAEPWWEEPNWIQVASLGDIPAGTPVTLRIPWNDAGPVRIVGSTTGSAYDVAFTVDGPSGPDVLFDPSQLGANAARSVIASSTGRVRRYDGSGVPIDDLGSVTVSLESTALTKAQIACANVTHGAFATLVGRLAKAEKACATAAVKTGTTAGLAACLAKADAKAAAVAAGLERKAARLCDGGAAPLGLPTPGAALAAATAAVQAQRARLFGTLADRLDEAMASAQSADCVLRVISQGSRCTATIGKTLATCVKDGLLGKSAPPTASLPFAFGEDVAACVGDDRRGKIVKACVSDVAKKVVAKCAPAVIAPLAPGCGADPLGPCLAAAGRCESCRAMVAHGNVRRSCDPIDDGAVDGSCL